MKTFALLLSSAVFLASGYVLIIDANSAYDLNHLIYISMLVVLMLICIVGIAINIPLIMAEKRRVKKLIKTKLNDKRLFPKMEMGL